MDLQSGASLWAMRNRQSNTYEPLKENISCDVLIVGGGIIGALVAYMLSKEKLSVVLIEKDTISRGSTIASTALLIYGLDVDLVDLIDMLGEEKAVRIYKLSFASVIEIKRIIEELKLECDYRQKKTLYLASDHKDKKHLEKEYEALKKKGFTVDYLNEQDLKERFSIDKEAAILRHDGAEVDPYKLTEELLRHAEKNGVRIYEHTETAIEDKHAPKNCKEKVLTKDGYAITAKSVVFATGYESQRYIGEDIVDLKSSYVIASKPIPELSSHFLKDCLVWETKRPYLYIRSTGDNRIIVGGEDEDIVDGEKRDVLIPEKSQKLKEGFETLVKNLPFSVEYAWAGTFGETKDGLGYIGTPKEYENIYFILGFGGNGITFGVIAAGMLRDLLIGEQSNDQDLFSFDRFNTQ